MTLCEVPELLSFLSSATRLDVKCTALEYVLGLTGSETGKEWMKANRDIFGKLLNLLNDQNEIISKDAHLAIVNLSADREVSEYFLSSIPQLLCSLQDDQCVHADKLCTILSNLSRSESGARHLFKQLIDNASTTLYQLVEIFDQWKTYNEHANFHYLASVFLNLSQVHEARRLFLDQSKCILPKLLPSTQSSASHIRRGGIAGLVKNLCFEVGK